jgi:hypothetical protein
MIIVVVVVIIIIIIIIGTPAVLVLQYIYRNKLQAGTGDQQMDYEYVIILWTALHRPVGKYKIIKKSAGKVERKHKEENGNAVIYVVL